MKRKISNLTNGADEAAQQKDGEPKRHNWEELLRSTKAIDVAKEKHRTIITIPSRSTVSEALQILADNNILSAPVVDSEKSLGFVDVMDIVGFVLAVWRKHCLVALKKGQDPAFGTSEEFFKSSISDVINFSLWNYPVNVLESSSLAEVMEALSSQTRHFKAHRVGVLNIKNELTNVISQSDIISFAAQHMDSIPTFLKKKTMTELHLLRTPILVRIDSSVSEALRTLYDSRVSGIALVDQESRLSGNLSASDLRGVLPKAFNNFSRSVLQFLAKGTETAYVGPPITCDKDSTLEDVISLLAKEKKHRVYIVDSSMHPIGVVTLTDILQLLHQ